MINVKRKGKKQSSGLNINLLTNSLNHYNYIVNFLAEKKTLVCSERMKLTRLAAISFKIIIPKTRSQTLISVRRNSREIELRQQIFLLANFLVPSKLRCLQASISS